MGAGGSIKDPGFTVIGTVLQGTTFLGAAYLLARTTGPVRLRDFGLVRAPLGPSIGKAAAISLAWLRAGLDSADGQETFQLET